MGQSNANAGSRRAQRGALKRRAIGLGFMLAAAAVSCAFADVEADKAAIAARLQRWAEAFNAHDATRTCDLFAPDLIASVRGQPDRGHDAICAQIAAALAPPTRKFSYTPDIREIIVSGDLAVVRIVWTLTVENSGATHTSLEPGVDIFRRQPNGSWAIIRYLVFSNDPG